MKKLLTISALTVTLGLAACQSSPTDLPPGSYERTTSSTNSYGTETKKKTNTTVYRDTDGSKKAIVHTKTTKDPKGLFNKTTTEDSVEEVE